MKNALSTDWTYAEFYAFTLLYAANADSRVTPEELDLIRPTLPAEQYEAVYAAFKSCSDMSALDHVLSYRDRYFSTDTAKKQLVSDMQAIFNADHDFCAIERGIQRIFERML